jgi:glycosyltransferase involved in cell wall biosynthesis
MSVVDEARARAAAGLKRYRQRRIWDAQMHPRIAWVSPMPPARSGIATYSAAVLAGLERIGYTDQHGMDVVWPVEPKHEGLVPWYRLGVYHLGNTVEFHRDIYRFASQAPGLIVLHDLALDDFVRGMKANGDPLGFAAEREAERLRDRLRGDEDVLRSEPMRDPWCAHVLRRSRGVVVHSAFAKRYVEEVGSRTPVFVVPHPVVEREQDMHAAAARRSEVRERAGAAADDLLVVAPGDLNAAKQLDAVLAAVSGLGPKVRLALVGRSIEGYDATGVLASAKLGNRATLHANVSDEDFRAWLFAADVVVDLRHPHRGEVSGSLARAMQAGRPSIVSATGSYLDAPDDAVLRVAPGPADPAEVADRIRLLAEDPVRRAQMGAAAAAHVGRLRETEATAHGYADAIEATLSLVRDPARRAYARWAGGLADLGIDDETLARGYGLAYAEAMEEFRPSS